MNNGPSENNVALEAETVAAPEEAVEEAVTAPTTPAPEPSKPKVMSREDMLRLENAYLKASNCDVQERLMRTEFAQGMTRVLSDKKKYQEELAALAQEYVQKYGIRLGEDSIAPDGTIVPKSAGSPPMNPPLPMTGTN